MKRFDSFMSVFLRASWLSLAVLGGCGTQVSTEYLGERMLALRGSVIVDNPTAPTDLVPVLAWERPKQGALPNAFLIEDVVHRGEFPARFQLEVFEPPPPAAFHDVTTDSGRQLRFAWAQVGAVEPEHPALLTLAYETEQSYCLGRECYTDLSRCDVLGSCYEERYHCSLPAGYDGNCREVGTRGDLDALPVMYEGFALTGYGGECTDTSCQYVYEWCVGLDPCLMPGAGDSCHYPEEDCYARILECGLEPGSQSAAALVDELDPTRWRERNDLSDCGVVVRRGNLEYAEDYSEWLAGVSEDVSIVFVPEGFDPVAFEEVIGVRAPQEAGYSLLVLAPLDDSLIARYRACGDSATRARVEAYNLEHGTAYSTTDGNDWPDDLSLSWVDDLNRCNRAVRGSINADPASTELTVHVGLPSAVPH